MTTIEIYPQLGQELVLDASDYCAYIRLGDITIYIPGDGSEKRADWLMGLWEQLTDHMANHTDPTHLTEYMAGYADKEHLIEYVQRAAGFREEINEASQDF